MDITICEFCKACVTNFEVHNCFNLGNQHHRSYANIPQSSSAYLAQNRDLRASQPVDYEARWSSMDQMNSSMQKRFLNNIHQRTGYEENAADEIFSQYGVTNPNPYNSVTSDYMFPGTHHIQENEPNSAYLQMPSEVFIHQNSQHYGPINSEHPTNIPVSVTERTILTGSQQTFGQRNVLMHQIAQHPSASSQMEFSGMSSTNNMSPHFSSVYHNFDQTDHTLTNRVSQYSEKSLGMPVLAIQNANYNRMNPTSRINCIQQTQPLASFSSLSCDVPLETSSYSMDTLYPNKEEGTLNHTETENPKYFASHFSLPCTSQNTVTYQEYRVNSPCSVKFKEDENYPKNKQWTDFSYGLAENISYNSRASQIHQHNFESGIKNSKIECHTWEHSNFVTSLSENKNACKISNTISASEVSGNLKKISEDKTFCRKACALKKLDVPQKPKTSYNCSKCPMTFRRKDYHESHECCHNVEKPYVCNFCDKAFSTCRNLGVHIMVKSDIHVRNAVNVFFTGAA
ncbi:hypothetical protein CEXT_631791 [Caerostris extrusa]|uniref:C2H2-type domain-containing protein n=1 Tax=Caerostris extrusa TaxID=172846 RepID=A0AAV4W7P6_CAEEX|nr:hypothetical protein CEXT_631791 [Caerostris extrusa]